MQKSSRLPSNEWPPPGRDDEITLPFRIVCERQDKDGSESDRGDRLDEEGSAEPSDEDSVS